MKNHFPNISEKDLIKGCLAREPQYYETLYARHSPKMFSICLRYAKDYHKAEDILQEGFIKIFKNLAKFRGDGSFEGWMRRIFVNTAIEQFRKNRPMYPIMEVDNSEHDVISDNTLAKLGAQELMKLVHALSPGYRAVFNLYVIEGYPHKEIAAMLNISEGTSKSQLARARYILQKKVLELESPWVREKYA